MNYLKVYINICRRGIKRLYSNNDPGSYEKHHVFPVSIYGKNDLLSLLTYKEHYIVHLLLIKILKKRYGIDDKRTQKMCFAIHKMVYRWDTNKKIKVNARQYAVARYYAKIAKQGIKRPDMEGKRFFGASEEKIKNGMKKMSQKKIGRKINYPKDRKSRGNQTEQTKSRISETKKKTNTLYINMNEQEFLNWINSKKMFTSDGRKNGNVVRAINARGEKIEKYYGYTKTT